MKKSTTKMYLYLARRDKKGIKILATINGSTQTARLTNLNILNLPHHLLLNIQQAIEENKMLYEAWVEPASSFHDFRARLKKKGFKNIPFIESPIFHDINIDKAFKDTTGAVQPVVKKTMLRRGS